MDGQLNLFDYMDNERNIHITPVEKIKTVTKRAYPCSDCHFWKDDGCIHGIDARKENCKKHKSLLFKNIEPGDWVEEEDLGEEITFNQIVNMVDEVIIIDMSTVSHAWYKAVLIEKVIPYEDGYRRFVYYDNHRQRGYVNEIYFTKEYQGVPQRAWKVKENILINRDGTRKE